LRSRAPNIAAVTLTASSKTTSDYAIAQKVGVGATTVRRAREPRQNGAVEKRLLRCGGY
jgi:hypothetical protein